MEQTSDRAAIERAFASDEEAATSAPWAAALPGELQQAIGIGNVEWNALTIAGPSSEILRVTPAGEWKWSERADELIAGMQDAGKRMILQRLRDVEAAASAAQAAAGGGEAIGEVQTYTGSIFDGAAAPFNRVVWKDGVQPPPGTKLYTHPAPAAPAVPPSAVPEAHADAEYQGVRCMCVLTACRAGPGCPLYTQHCRKHIEWTEQRAKATGGAAPGNEEKPE